MYVCIFIFIYEHHFWEKHTSQKQHIYMYHALIFASCHHKRLSFSKSSIRIKEQLVRRQRRREWQELNRMRHEASIEVVEKWVYLGSTPPNQDPSHHQHYEPILVGNPHLNLHL